MITYIYNDEVGPNFDFKALSADPVLKDDFVFMAVDQPSKALQQDEKLPGLVGRMRKTENYGAGSFFTFNGM